MAQKDYWFKAKKYGWGWGLPRNRNGWISFAIFFAVWLGALAWITSVTSQTEPRTEQIALFVAIILADCAGLFYVSWKHGEPPKNLGKLLKRSKKRGTTQP